MAFLGPVRFPGHLVDCEVIEHHRAAGESEAVRALLNSERERFLREEWPIVLARLQRLGLDLKTLMRDAPEGGDAKETP